MNSPFRKQIIIASVIVISSIMAACIIIPYSVSLEKMYKVPTETSIPITIFVCLSVIMNIGSLVALVMWLSGRGDNIETV